MPGTKLIERRNAQLNYPSLRASSFLHVALSKGLTMTMKQDLDICIIGMSDTRTSSVLSREDHACVSFFATVLEFRTGI